MIRLISTITLFFGLVAAAANGQVGPPPAIVPLPFNSVVCTYPLDGIAAAAGAYSYARKLSSTYAGNAFTITRASDSTTQAVGFSGCAVNTSTISTFCSGTTCNVTTLNDQSGNTRDFTQGTRANAPTIYTGGAVVTVAGLNSKVAPTFNGTSTQLTRASATTTLTPSGSAFTFFSVWRATAYPTAGNSNDIAGVSDTNNGIGIGYDNTPRLADGSTATIAGAISIGAAPVNDMVLIRTSALTNGTAQTLYRNGSGSTSTVNWGNTFTNGDTLSMGSNFRPTFFTGNQAEIYFFTSQLSTTDTNLLANSAATFYALTWTNI